MKLRTVAVLAVLAACTASTSGNPDVAAWEAYAANVTITRDDWGIAHVKGKTDAEAVFGMIYAQAEDDFNRIETNYLNSMGRLAEAEGESAIWRDLRMKMFIDPEHMKQLYADSPDWLVKLMDAWAAGLNYYLHTHPEVKPRVLTKFEPWMALTFSEGSIGGDIERVNLQRLQELHDSAGAAKQVAVVDDGWEPEPRGSNGIAIGGPMTANGKAMLLINPHTSFFFRSELQMTSDEGLNAYGASTWGQFFIYQGFNERAGWMHTSSSVDNVDEYIEEIVETDRGVFYRHGTELKPVTVKKLVVPYKTGTGMSQREFTTWRTHHGPINRRTIDGKYIATRLMEEPLKALRQSYLRTRVRNLQDFRETMDLHTNSSNNTLYADADGNYAYFHANFVPKRDPKVDFGKAVQGKDPATDWQGVHTIDESPNVISPPNGWVYNTNNFPYTAAGSNSPKQASYATYFDVGSENPRGVHAIRVLENRKEWTLDSLLAAAYDAYMPAFEKSIPALVKAWESAPAGALKTKLADPIAQLKGWDFRWSATSVPTSLAVFWGEEMFRRQRADEHPESESMTAYDYMERGPVTQRLEGLASAMDKLTADFGKWQTPWGEINRFQRLTNQIVHPFDDAGPSIPVMFTSARWGSLASFGARPSEGTKKWYGTSGNSFVAVVEFGDRVRARAVTAGGESGDVKSKHFNDQAERYASGNLREVYFYPEQLQGHTERTYRPGK